MTMIKGNRTERENVLDILAVCGILQPAGHPGYADAFIPASGRLLPGHRHVFGHYPVCWWTAGDGVNDNAVAKFFPQLS